MYMTEEEYISERRRKQFAKRLKELIDDEFDDLHNVEVLDVLASEVHGRAYRATVDLLHKK